MKTRTKILCGALLAAAMVIGLMVFSSGGSRRAVDAYKDQLRAQGEKLTIAELAPVPPQGSYSNAQAFLSAIGVTHSPANFPPMMKMVAPGRAMVGWQQKESPVDKLPDVWPVLATELKTFREMMPDKQVILDTPVLFFDLDYSKGFSIALTHLPKLKQGEWLTAISAMAALHDRNYPEAWTNVRAAVTLVRRYQAEPLIISHLVRDSMANIAIPVTWEFLQCDEWSDAQLAELQSGWEAMEFFYATETAFEMERVVMMDCFRTARKSYDDARSFISAGPASSASLIDDPRQFIVEAYDRYPKYWGWKRKWSFDEEMMEMQEITAVTKAIRSVRQGAIFASAVKSLEQETAELATQHTNAIPHYLLGGFASFDWPGKALKKHAEAETGRRVVVVAIALKRYRLEYGQYPESLNALLPVFLKQMPLDLMDGKPLRYKPGSDGGFLLYSVGEDGVDDGGDPTPTTPEAMRTKYWLRGRDIVWPVPATAKENDDYFKAQTTNAATNVLPPAFKSSPNPINPPSGNHANGK